MSLRFSTCTKRQRLQNENVSQKFTTLHYLYPFSFTSFYVYIATPKHLEGCRWAASQSSAVPWFQFPPLYPFILTQNLIGPILLRIRFCDSSCKQKAVVQCAPTVASVMLLPFLYLSTYPITLYVCHCSDADTSPFYLVSQISQTVSATFYSFTYSLELVWVALSGKRRRWICQKTFIWVM